VSSNSIGKVFVFTCIGESHGLIVGAIIDGCPAGLPLTEADVQSELDKRRPGLSGVSTPRMEGFYQGSTEATRLEPRSA